MKWDESEFRDLVNFLAQKFFEEDEKRRGPSGQMVRSLSEMHYHMAWTAIKAMHEWNNRTEDSK